MPYVKPGIEVKQVQRSMSPVLVSPELEACIIGDGFWIQDITWDDPQNNLRNSVYSQYLEGTSNMTIPLSGINPYYFNVQGDEQLVHIDLLGVAGPETGKVRHLNYGQHFSVSNNIVTISGIAGNTSKFQVKIGFRAKRPNLNTVQVLESLSDVSQTIGEPVSWNPLAFGAYLAMLNSNSKVKVYGLPYNASNPVGEFTNALTSSLTLEDVYVLAPVTHNADITALSTHCNVNSLPQNKKERIAIVNKVISYPTDPKLMTSTQKAQVAGNIRDANSAIQNRRIVSTHPDAAYILETRHIATVRPSWINASFSYTTTKTFNTYGPYAKLVNDFVAGNIKYKAGTEITDSVWNTLVANGWGGDSGIVTVLVPVPGYYFSAAIAGQMISTSPEQPLTNVPIAGFAEVFGSQDIFSEDNLNTMAEGGTYILTQKSKSSPIVSRHQLATDITSVARREISITKSLDYTAKMLRRVLEPYIGRYTINENFIKLLKAIVFATGSYLIREDILNDFKVSSVVQDTTNPDTILVEVEVLVKYPVNYIKITLVF